jgi:hypothetical protein
MRRGERHGWHSRITATADVTVDTRVRPAQRRAAFMKVDTERKERIMPRLDLGAVRPTFRTALRRLDAWTLDTP